MSVNPDDMNMASGVATEFVDLEHQVIRQKLNALSTEDVSADVGPGDVGAEFAPGERQLDREEIAQLVYYRRIGSINFLQTSGAGDEAADQFAIVDASIGINGDLFREVTTQAAFDIAGQPDLELFVDTGGEIGLIDNYQLYAQPQVGDFRGDVNQVAAGGGIAQNEEYHIDFYNWPTGGPIVDSFDTITAGFGFGADTVAGGSQNPIEVQVELRYDLWWDVAEQGRSTNPFGRPSTR
jgi:hypothetical protein